MFSGVKSFLGRHKRKFLIGGIVIGGFVMLTSYSSRRIIEWHQREVRQLLRKTRRHRHYAATERSCDDTIKRLFPTLRCCVVRAADTESVVEKLRRGCDDKVASWNELKILAFTRTSVVIYSTTMLVILLRIQMNLIGATSLKNFSKLDDEINDENPSTANDREITESEKTVYLGLCRYFMSEGVEKLTSFIRDKIDKCTGGIDLMDKLTIRQVEEIYWSLMSSVTADVVGDPVKNIAAYTMGEKEYTDDRHGDSTMGKIVRETIDILESDEVRDLTRRTLTSGFARLVDHVAEYFVDTNAAGNNDCTINFNAMKMPMAKIIPIVNGQMREEGKNDDFAGLWLLECIANDSIKTLAANIYEAFSF